jgi:uncharacterized DUF497 family protein
MIPFILLFADPAHSDDENRYLAIGESDLGELLIVSLTPREPLTRLISARKAEPNREKEICQSAQMKKTRSALNMTWTS